MVSVPGEGRRIYAPVVDVAVGPFATERQYEARYAELLERTRVFVEHLIEKHNQNVEETEQTSFESITYFNESARCLLCIEIEESGGRKHCLGDLVNASALGGIGLLILRSDKVVRTFVRQRRYLRYLADVGKNTFKTTNALVLTEDQFDECLLRATQDRREQLLQTIGSLGEHLVRMPVRVDHHPDNILDIGIGNGWLEQVAHTVDENSARGRPAERFRQFFRN